MVLNPLAFSTLACPEWGVDAVLFRAKRFGYDGIEWRGGPDGHINPDMPETAKSSLRLRSEQSGLLALSVNAYTTFVSPDRLERQRNIEELKRYIDLAAQVRARNVRTFLGKLEPGVPPDRAAGWAIASLEPVVEYAEQRGVVIALEPHDDFVECVSILPVLERIPHPALKVIWDFANAFSAGEAPETGFAVVKDRIAYVQVKDGRGRGAAWQLTPLGQGDVPLEDIFRMLLGGGYRGAFSLEWERAWHPELDPAEIALPQALETLRGLIRKHRLNGALA